jgi:DNA processing protein
MIENGGAIISEFNSTDKPDREHFLQRNRIVAGFSSITIVVETAFGGGSMSTVSYANGYNREVYALLEKFRTNTAKDAILLFLRTRQNHQQVSGYIR